MTTVTTEGAQDVEHNAETREKTAPRVRMTARDRRALEWLSGMYGAPIDLVARLLGTTERRAYALVSRWKQAGWVRTGQVDAGRMWVWPTRATATVYLGWDPGDWVPRPSQAAHLRACAITRLALDATGTDWTSERALRHATPAPVRGTEQPYLSDGEWHSPRGTVFIEVELTPKGPERTYQVVRRALAEATRRGAAAVMYVTANKAVTDQVEAAYQRARTEHTGLTAQLTTTPLTDIAARIDVVASHDIALEG